MSSVEDTDGVGVSFDEEDELCETLAVCDANETEDAGDFEVVTLTDTEADRAGESDVVDVTVTDTVEDALLVTEGDVDTVGVGVDDVNGDALVETVVTGDAEREAGSEGRDDDDGVTLKLTIGVTETLVVGDLVGAAFDRVTVIELVGDTDNLALDDRVTVITALNVAMLREPVEETVRVGEFLPEVEGVGATLADAKLEGDLVFLGDEEIEMEEPTETERRDDVVLEGVGGNVGFVDAVAKIDRVPPSFEPLGVGDTLTDFVDKEDCVIERVPKDVTELEPQSDGEGVTVSDTLVVPVPDMDTVPQ